MSPNLQTRTQPQAPAFTVAICTAGRPESLKHAAASALAQEGAPAFEVLVVDNGPEPSAETLSPHPLLRVAAEPGPGLSHARNRALEEAQGRVVVFLDDDAELDPGYLARLEQVVREEPLAALYGGPVRVGWKSPPPDWYEPGLEPFLNRLDLGSVRRAIRYPEFLYGTNLAVDVEFLKKIGGFDTRFGRRPGLLADCEDAEICLRTTTRSARTVIYDPGLIVTHFWTRDRLAPEYLTEKAWWHGRTRRLLETRYPSGAGLLSACLNLTESLVRTFSGQGRGTLTEKLVRAAAAGYLLPPPEKKLLPAK